MATPYIADEEARNGVRCSWNNFPASRVEQQRLLLPLGCMYTPLKDINYAGHTANTKGLNLPTHPKEGQGGVHLAPYDPVRCRGVIKSESRGGGVLSAVAGVSPGGAVTGACGAVLNMHCPTNLANKTWSCPICGHMNALSPYYAEHMALGNMPPETQLGTMEYQLGDLQVLNKR